MAKLPLLKNSEMLSTIIWKELQRKGIVSWKILSKEQVPGM
jgi:hypothetical protein